uniref:C2H2-type domain-containing protein n=1 Tax=Kalmanozyma brasiliensis (strain GHG001) TaxID=1365824 RepID=V5GGI4_KALBG
MDILGRHARIHSQERPFTCHFRDCGKTFIQRSALTVHIRVHTGERPHVCESCSKALRIHTGRRPYKCLVAGCGKSFCRKTTLTKHTRRNHADAEGTYSGVGGPMTIMSNSSSMNRCVLPPQTRATFPQGLEHHYLANLKVEDDSAVAHYGLHLQQTADYPSTPFSAPAMSTSSSGMSFECLDISRRSSTTSGYMSSNSHSFYSPASNHGRSCPTPTPNTLTPASEMSQFPRTPDFRDARAFEVQSAARPQFNNLSIANMSFGACATDAQTSPSGFNSSMMGSSQSFAMMPNFALENQSTSNIDPNLWDAGTSSAVPNSSVGSHFYEQQSYQQPRPTIHQHFQQQQHMQGSQEFVQPATSHERMGSYFSRPISQQHLASST